MNEKLHLEVLKFLVERHTARGEVEGAPGTRNHPLVERINAQLEMIELEKKKSSTGN